MAYLPTLQHTNQVYYGMVIYGASTLLMAAPNMAIIAHYRLSINNVISRSNQEEHGIDQKTRQP